MRVAAARYRGCSPARRRPSRRWRAKPLAAPHKARVACSFPHHARDPRARQAASRGGGALRVRVTLVDEGSRRRHPGPRSGTCNCHCTRAKSARRRAAPGAYCGRWNAPGKIEAPMAAVRWRGMLTMRALSERLAVGGRNLHLPSTTPGRSLSPCCASRLDMPLATRVLARVRRSSRQRICPDAASLSDLGFDRSGSLGRIRPLLHQDGRWRPPVGR